MQRMNLKHPKRSGCRRNGPMGMVATVRPFCSTYKCAIAHCFDTAKNQTASLMWQEMNAILATKAWIQQETSPQRFILSSCSARGKNPFLQWQLQPPTLHSHVQSLLLLMLIVEEDELKTNQFLEGPRIGSNNFRDCVNFLMQFGVVEVPARACIHCATANRFKQFSEGPWISSNNFWDCVNFLMRFGVVEVPARACSHCATKNWMKQFSEGLRISSNTFRIEWTSWCNFEWWRSQPGLGVTVRPKIGSNNFRKVQESVKAIFGFRVNFLMRFGVVEVPARKKQKPQGNLSRGETFRGKRASQLCLNGTKGRIRRCFSQVGKSAVFPV